jgi:radical SAM superfamily enzyme YgiQ (UPF0313 family)
MFIIGFDTDTADTIDETYRFIQDNNIGIGILNVLTPFPGTKYYDEFMRDGRLLGNSWNDYDLMHVVFRPAHISARELQNRRYELTRKLNKTSAILKRLLHSRAQIGFGLLMNFSMRKLFRFIDRY